MQLLQEAIQRNGNSRFSSADDYKTFYTQKTTYSELCEIAIVAGLTGVPSPFNISRFCDLL
jgi:hypothetical protein